MNYQTLLMMIADAPHYESGRKTAGTKGGGEEKDEVLEFFRSNLG